MGANIRGWLLLFSLSSTIQIAMVALPLESNPEATFYRSLAKEGPPTNVRPPPSFASSSC